MSEVSFDEPAPMVVRTHAPKNITSGFSALLVSKKIVSDVSQANLVLTVASFAILLGAIWLYAANQPHPHVPTLQEKTMLEHMKHVGNSAP